MVGAGNHMELGRNAGSIQATRVFQCFFKEQVQGTDGDTSRRQTTQIDGAGRHGADGHIRTAGLDAE